MRPPLSERIGSLPAVVMESIGPMSMKTFAPTDCYVARTLRARNRPLRVRCLPTCPLPVAAAQSGRLDPQRSMSR